MASNGTATDPPTSETSPPPAPPSSAPPSSSPSPQPPPPSSTANDTPTPSPSPSPSDPPSSSAAPPPPSSKVQTSVVTASSRPPSTQVITSVVPPTASDQNQEPSTIVITSVVSHTDAQQSGGSQPSSAPPSSSTAPAGLQGLESEKAGDGGLSTGGKTAIAVVVPVVVVALLVVAGILLWRRRKQKKNAAEARRKEVEEYGFNPNHDPTLPAVGMGAEMAEDQSGYRGWGNATTSSNRKASTTLTSGMTGYSDSNSNPGGYQSPGSPTHAYSDNHSNDPLMNGRRETLDSEGIGALGAAPNASQNQGNINRGPSNASSSYSAANRSDNSGDYPIPVNNPQDYYDNNNYYGAPYGNDPYAGTGQPVIRDVSARRNTRIENPSVFPQQGNSGIAQNF